MNKAEKLLCVALSAVVLYSCSKQEKNELSFDYVPVQLSKDDNWSIIDKDGKVIVKDEYPSDANFSKIKDEVFWVKQDGKYQLFSLQNPKMPVIDDEFTGVTSFAAGVSAVSAPNEPIRIINTKGETVATLPTNIEVCCAFSKNGYAVFIDNENRYGLLDSKGTTVIPADDQVFLGSESEGLVLVKKNDQNIVEILDLKGQKKGEIDTEKYDIRTVLNEGKMTVSIAGDSQSPIIILDNTGKKLFDIKHSSAANSAWIGYVDGYIIFSNEDGKFGVANDKGEIVIRPKYDYLDHLGKGLFGAMKKGSAGIVNSNDENVIDFNYTGFICSMGPNFLMLDDGEYLLIDKDAKEIATFPNFNFSQCDKLVEYVDVEGLTDGIVEKLLNLATPKTAAQWFKDSEEDVDNWHNSSKVFQNYNINNRAFYVNALLFNGSATEEKTHIEEVDDGWFTTSHTVSDGWAWSDNVINNVVGIITLEDVPSKAESICKAIGTKLQEASYEVDCGEYTKKIALGDTTYESRISLTPEEDKITVEIRFYEF